MKGWRKLGAVDPTKLVETRLQLHWAAQLVGVTGAALARPGDDDSHTAITCAEGGALLVGRATDTPTPVRVGLDVPSFAIRVLDESLAELGVYPLADRTLRDALSWVGEEIGRRASTTAPKLKLSDYDMPEHAVGKGSPFERAEPSHLEEMVHWFGNAALELEAVRAANAASSEIVLWPHHFDIATLLRLDENRTINVGLSPGDGTYAEPYWYVSPWPYPDVPPAVELAGGGHWHTSGFVAAILTGGREAQQVESFITSALEASREILGDR